MNRWKKAIVSCLTLIVLGTALPGCDPGYNTQMGELNHIVFAFNYDDWKWLRKNGAANGKDWYPYMNWSSDDCSAPLVGDSQYAFDYPCRRHDFSWRNLKRVERDFNRDVWNGGNKNAADYRFKDDLYSRCGEFHWSKRPGCWLTAEAYFTAVNVLSPYGRRTGSFGW